MTRENIGRGEKLADELRGEINGAKANEYRSVLERIAALDAATDSEEGYNEWGEADCFHQARKLARDVLGAA